MTEQTLAELGALLRSKRITSPALTAAALARAAQQSDLNAFAGIHEEAATKSAIRAEEMLGTGNADRLCGLPVAIKDIFCTRVGRTTCGSKMLADYVSPYESHASERLLEAGAVIIGKTNLDEFAMGTTGENSAFGATLNPWARNRVAGGSSSGSAAAVAARIVPMALGSDTGGSVRMPAAYCGICAIKPSYGLVSRRGMVAYASSLDQAGVLATSAACLRTALRAIAGHDPDDSTSLPDCPIPAPRARQDLQGLRIGIVEDLFTAGIAAGVASRVREAIAALVALGASTTSISLPSVASAVPAYYLIACAEASSNLSRYDGIRYGHNSQGDNLEGQLKRARSEGFGREVQRRIMLGTFVLSHGYADQYYWRARHARRRITGELAQHLASCDLLAAPAAPTVAPLLNSFADDPVRMYSQDMCTAPASLAGLPALAIPCGAAEHDMPASLQLIGAAQQEALLLDVAEIYQDNSEHHRQCPPGAG